MILSTYTFVFVNKQKYIHFICVEDVNEIQWNDGLLVSDVAIKINVVWCIIISLCGSDKQAKY